MTALTLIAVILSHTRAQFIRGVAWFLLQVHAVSRSTSIISIYFTIACNCSTSVHGRPRAQMYDHVRGCTSTHIAHVVLHVWMRHKWVLLDKNMSLCSHIETCLCQTTHKCRQYCRKIFAVCIWSSALLCATKHVSLLCFCNSLNCTQIHDTNGDSEFDLRCSVLSGLAVMWWISDVMWSLSTNVRCAVVHCSVYADVHCCLCWMCCCCCC